MFDITTVYALADQVVEKILAADKTWRMCYPCNKNGKCCIHADINAYPCELESIKNKVEGDEKLKDKILDSVRNNKKCIFYDKTATMCLIFDTRPLICRLTPFWVRRHNGQTFYNRLISKNCDFQKGIIPNVTKIDEGLIIDSVPYINLNRFEDMIPEPSKNVFDFFVNHFRLTSCY